MITDKADKGEYLDGEEVGSGDLAPMGLQEGPPWHPFASLFSGFDAVLEENALDSIAAKLDSETVKGAADPGVAPARIAQRHLNHERASLLPGARSAGTTFVAPIVLVGDEFAVPTQDRVGCNDRGELTEEFPSEYLALDRQPTALVVGETNLFCAHLLAKNLVLFLEVFDYLKLSAVHPASEQEEQEPQRLCTHVRHRSGPQTAVLG